ncbi:MAG: hypothetical protein CMI54_04925 [Parcubacteria group bacterium]|nr:hypothetical protein [Parcubacteria group bacterium]|tara:strand:+ start:1447 stop:1773 length:327 start_codon:yes stop_codon:yes gene_type:complete
MLSILFIFWLVLFIASSLAFDRLIQYQNQNYHQSWTLDGKPRGMFYNPENSSYSAMCSLSFKLPNTKPEWVQGDNNAEQLYANYKFLGKIIKWYAIAFLPLVFLSISI